MDTIIQADPPWKEALEKYFPQFMAFFFPKAHAAIYWNREWTFLDKELEQIVRDAELGRRLVDKLVQVWDFQGQESWILLHIEVQGNRDADFPRRMYRYHYRIGDRYDRPVVSFAILTDENPKWRPQAYEYSQLGNRLLFKFCTVKLLDYQPQLAELEQNPNPFAVVVMAHLQAQATRHNPNDRLRWKLRLIKGLYRRGLNREDILELFRIIDWLMALPEDLERQFQTELKAFEEERQMRYVTTIERWGEQRGEERGERRGERRGAEQKQQEIVTNMLKEQMPIELIAKLSGLSIEEIQQLQAQQH
jgi:predicted transposase YdaD